MLDAERNQIDLLAEEFSRRLRDGETPAIDDYVRQHPGLKDEIEELFPTIAALEGLRRKKERSSDGRASMGPAKLRRLGDFRILREIGRGGMGVVYEAEQESLSRRVAVKVLPKQSLLDEKHLRRFQREARTAARLHHTNIVPILAVGVHDGFHYYAMQIIDGVGLDQIILRMAEQGVGDLSSQHLTELWRKFRFEPARGHGAPTAMVDTNHFSDSSSVPAGSPLTGPAPTATPAPLSGRPAPAPDSGGSQATASASASAEAKAAGNAPNRSRSATYWQNVASIGVQAASALSYAHQHGVLHRDIKPGNLILDESGIVWVADFGLAKASEQEAVSRTGDIVGTLRFMAPEQLLGEADARSDIYALGVTLYEMLTLQPAHRESTRKQALLTGSSTSQVAPPRKVNPSIPRDLETIILKCIADDPSHRYPNGDELAEDLQRFIDDRSILARRASRSERVKRWARRNPAVAALSALAATLLALIALIATIGYVRTQDALDQAVQQRQKVQAAVYVSLEALDRVYERYAPDRVLEDSNVSVGEEGDEENRVDLPAPPELSPESVALLRDLLNSYDKLAELDIEDVNLKIEVAKANRRLGDIYQRLDQAEQAMNAYLHAITLTDQLVDTVEDPQKRIELETSKARIRNDLGSVYRRMGERFTASQTFHTSLNSLKRLVTESNAPEVRFELARTHYLLSGGSFGSSRGLGPSPGFGFSFRRRRPEGPPYDEGDNLRETNGETLRPPLEELPETATDTNGSQEVAKLQQTKAPASARKVRRLSEESEGPDRERRFDDSNVTREERRSPPSNRGPRDLAEHHPGGRESGSPPNGPERRSMRPSFRKIDQKESDHLQQAIKLLGQLQQENPTVPEYRRMLALCYREQFHAGDTEAIGRAVKSLNELVEQYPHVDDYRYDLAVTTAASAWVESEDIESILRGAIEHARQLDLNSPTYAVALADMNSSLAIHLVRSASEANDPNSLDEAQEMLEEAVRIHTGLVKANPDNASYRGRAANSLQGLARFIVERSDDEDNLRRAESLLARAAKQLDVLVAHRDTNPTLTGLHWPLARIHERRADYLTLLSQFEQAQRASAKAAAHREKLEKWRSHRYRQGRRK